MDPLDQLIERLETRASSELVSPDLTKLYCIARLTRAVEGVMLALQSLDGIGTQLMNLEMSLRNK